MRCGMTQAILVPVFHGAKSAYLGRCSNEASHETSPSRGRCFVPVPIDGRLVQSTVEPWGGLLGGIGACFVCFWRRRVRLGDQPLFFS